MARMKLRSYVAGSFVIEVQGREEVDAILALAKSWMGNVTGNQTLTGTDKYLYQFFHGIAQDAETVFANIEKAEALLDRVTIKSIPAEEPKEEHKGKPAI